MRWFLPAILALAGCGTDAVGVETCKKIEHERCLWAEACGINIDNPLHGVVRRARSTSPVDDCFRVYEDACLHGLPVKDPEDKTVVEACVKVIRDGDCTAVLRPESAPACSWLIPPPDSGADTGTDAGSD